MQDRQEAFRKMRVISEDVDENEAVGKYAALTSLIASDC